MQEKTFSAKAFHIWPFGGGQFWRGFIERSEIIIKSGTLEIHRRKKKWSVPLEDLEFVIKRNRWFRMGNPLLRMGYGEGDVKPNDLDYSNEDSESILGLSFLFKQTAHINKNDYEEFVTCLKEENALCFRDSSVSLESSIPFYAFFRKLNGNKDSLWLNERHVISSSRSQYAVNTPSIKYLYSKGMLTQSLYVGAHGGNVCLKNGDRNHYDKVQAFISKNGGNIAQETDSKYKGVWSLNMLWCIPLWFTKSSIGFTDKGIVYNQRTLKSADNIFLPYDKIRIATYQRKWYMPFTQEIGIYGEQNIEPKRRFSKNAVAAIKERLKKEGIKETEGVSYRPSVLRHWWEVLLSGTIIYYLLAWIRSLLWKRSKIIVGEDSIVYKGRICRFTGYYDSPKKLKSLTVLVFHPAEVLDMVYVKKKWYHLWGTVAIYVRIDNIRNQLDEASQESSEFIFGLGKMWGRKKTALRDALERIGASISNEKDLKDYVKTNIKKFNR